MRSLCTLFYCATILLFVAAEDLYESSTLNNHSSDPSMAGVSVQAITEPVGLGEGPHWDQRSQKLYFVDIHAQKVYALHTTSQELTSTYIANGPVGYVVPVDDSPDQFIGGAGTDLITFTWNSENSSSNLHVDVLATVDRDKSHNRFNDAKVDSHGRLWAGTMGPEDKSGVAPNQGSLYLIESDLIPKKVLSLVSISNGLAWNIEDNKMYYIDSPTRQIVSYDYEAHTGNLTNKRIAFDLRTTNISGEPDGMTIDIDGNLWIAIFNGGSVLNVDPVDGRLIRRIVFPATRITSATFGGPLLDILYVTTSSYGLTPAERELQPKAGSVFAVTGLGVRGFLPNSFARH